MHDERSLAGTDGSVAFSLSSNANNSYPLYWGTGTGNTVNTPTAVAPAGQVQVLSEVKNSSVASTHPQRVHDRDEHSSVDGSATTPVTLAMGNAAYPHYGFTGQVAGARLQPSTRSSGAPEALRRL